MSNYTFGDMLREYRHIWPKNLLAKDEPSESGNSDGESSGSFEGGGSSDGGSFHSSSHHGGGSFDFDPPAESKRRIHVCFLVKMTKIHLNLVILL